jgi:hypothetical protein
MSALAEQPIIGLFGTCGDSSFRQGIFIPEYERLGITYFNPQVDDWQPELAAIEADHLAHDVVQCWPVLGSTYGTGSLAEQGYSVASSLRAPTPLPKFVIPMIEQELDEALDNPVARKESERARKLAAAHLSNVTAPDVFVVESLDEMLETSVQLFGVAQTLVELARDKSPAYRRFIDDRRVTLQILQDAMASGNLGQDARTLAQRLE